MAMPRLHRRHGGNGSAAGSARLARHQQALKKRNGVVSKATFAYVISMAVAWRHQRRKQHQHGNAAKHQWRHQQRTINGVAGGSGVAASGINISGETAASSSWRNGNVNIGVAYATWQQQQTRAYGRSNEKHHHLAVTGVSNK